MRYHVQHLSDAIWTGPAETPVRSSGSDVEADVEDVPVLDDVGLALEALEPSPRRLGLRAALDQVVPADHLAADEAAGDVGVDRLRRLERGLAVPERPGSGLLSPAVKKATRPRASLSRTTTSSSADGPVRNSAASSGGSSAELRLELASMPPGPFTIATSGFVVSGSSPLGKLAAPLRQRPALVEVREDALESARLPGASRRRRTSPPSHPLEPPLDVVAVGDEQLEPQRLQVAPPDRPRPRTRRARRAAHRPGGDRREAAARSRARRRP